MEDKAQKTKTGKKPSPLYEKLYELVVSLPPGTPLPPVHWLKREYQAGYSALNRALRQLEAEGRVAIRKNKGIFAVEPPEAKGRGDEAEGFPIPWVFQGKALAGICVPKHPGCEVWKKLVQDYNGASPIKKFELSFIEEKKLKGVFGEGKDFDLAVFPTHLDMRLRLKEHDLLDMTRHVASFKPELPLYDEIWDRMSGPVIGVAPSVAMTLMAYRKDVFKERGVALSSYPLPEEILMAAEALKSDFRTSTYVFFGYMAHFHRMGVPLVGDAGDKLTFDPASVKPVLDFLYKVSVTEKLSPFCSESYQIYSSKEKLLSRNGAMLECPAGLGLEEREYGFLPMPALRDGSEPLFTPVMCVGKNTFYPEECWDFIAYVLSERGQKIIAEKCLGLPAAKDVLPAHLGQERIAAMRSAASRGKVFYRNSITFYEFRFILEMLVERWLKGLMPLEELCAEIVSRGNRFIARFSSNF